MIRIFIHGGPLPIQRIVLKNNAVELGDRTWNKNKRFGHRRTLMEEAQEVKAFCCRAALAMH